MAKPPKTACGLIPQAAGGEVVTLPSTKCKVHYRFPLASPETLKTLLRLGGAEDPYLTAVVDGLAPREFALGITWLWKMRDAYYTLATEAVQVYLGHGKEVPPSQIAVLLLESITPENRFDRNLERSLNEVRWVTCPCVAGSFLWPSSIPQMPSKALLTVLRLRVLHTIWIVNPALLAQDFGACIGDFSDENLAQIQKVIATSDIPEKSHFMEAAPDLSAEINRLLGLLRDGPQPCRELVAAMGLKRGLFLKKALIPAEAQGLIEKTERGSSPRQKYRLTEAGVAAMAEQVRLEGVTGSDRPVTAELKKREKQDLLPRKGFMPGGVIFFHAGGCAPVRLARYRRWEEWEKVAILYFRVERLLRSLLGSGRGRELAIGKFPGESTLYDLGTCLVDPLYWGEEGGVKMYASMLTERLQTIYLPLGERNLLKLLAKNPKLELATCSISGLNEMARMEPIISPAELYLMEYYADYFHVPRGLDTPYHGEGNSIVPQAVDPYDVYRPSVSKIVFHGRMPGAQSQLIRCSLNGLAMLLPVRHYASAKNPNLSCVMPEVPDSPVLYNSDAIAAEPDAIVVLSDEIGIPLVNDNDSDLIYSSWYGGLEVAEKLDYELLRGRQIWWLCFDTGNDPRKKFEKALKVAEIFLRHDLDMQFLVFDHVTWKLGIADMAVGHYDGSRLLSLAAFKREAAKYGVYAALDSGSNVAPLNSYSLGDLCSLEPHEYILYPVLKAGAYCLIFGATGTAKTWVGLHLAIALSQGVPPFERWEVRGGPRNVLYVAGEMEAAVYGERVRSLLAGASNNNTHFTLIRENLDLATDGDQTRILSEVEAKKVKIVFFDNLSTLAVSGHTEGQFGKIHALIQQLQAAGVAVVLIHHENRQGGYKGSGRIELVADQSLHLYQAGEGNKIELLVQAEKIRTTSRKEQPAFRTEFDPKKPMATWPMFELTAEERRRLDIDDPLGEVELNVGKKRNNQRLAWRYLSDDSRAVAIIDDMLSGCSDDVIAANLAVREVVVSDFKKQHGISAETLQQHLPEASTQAKKNNGKETPATVAPEIWNFLKGNGNELKKNGTERM